MLREFIERKRCFYNLTKYSREKLSDSESSWENKFFNIPPGEDFAYALVRGLEDRLKAEGDKGPDRFADIVIISNTARSIKRLKSVFFERHITKQHYRQNAPTLQWQGHESVFRIGSEHIQRERIPNKSVFKSVF